MEPDHSSREIDTNGFVTITRNPITRTGVFKYSGRSIPGADPTKIYNVLRPVEEVSSPEAIKSFQLLPIIDDHPSGLLSPNLPAEEKGTHGTTGEDVVFDGDILYAPVRIFSETLKSLISLGKKQLSAAYKCRYEKSSGFFKGLAYDYIQRDIRGNHIALVAEGRSGPDIAVLDSMAFDHFDLALDQTETEESQMADDAKAKDESKEDSVTEEKAEMTLSEVVATLKEIMPQIKSLQEMVSAAQADPVDGEALDKDTEEKEGDESEKKEAMDSADVSQLKARIAKLEARGTKEILSDITSRDKIVKDVTPFIGTFDHAEKTTDEVVSYACDKLDIKVEKGHELAALTGFIKAKSSAKVVSFAQDSTVKSGSLLDKTLKGAKA